ncbi:UPF0149 family protein [Pelagibaculum spongiae]|uniref:YecA family protein n=1 Tax=Pelagibaculum spongiae TaxID=2080658 RepID=A0A2V1GTL6_9GAMM|nr:UPF0149 family protein [Pelagibaculum spongiae]PVZ69025.1 hypothetical protein DC094_12390 [Pelagibaculum spongiae]
MQPCDLYHNLEDQLAELLPESDSALSPLGSHGYLTALAVNQTATSKDALSQQLSGEETSEPTLELLAAQLLESIEKSLYRGEKPELPCSLHLGNEPDDSELREWAAAFFEVIMDNPDRWHPENHQEEIARLMLPIQLAAGVLEPTDEQAVLKNRKLSKQILQEMPNVLQELYLLYQEQIDQ